jgi:hypothetical protein
VVVQSGQEYVTKEYVDPAKAKADTFCIDATGTSCAQARQWLEYSRSRLEQYSAAADAIPNTVTTEDGQWVISWDKQVLLDPNSKAPGVVLTYIGQGSPYEEQMLRLAAIGDPTKFGGVAATAEAMEIESLGDRLDALEDRLNSEVTEDLRASLRSVTFKRVDYVCDYNDNNHYCSARCDGDEILISGGCFLPNAEVGLISSSWLDPNDYRKWNCHFYEGRFFRADLPRLTKIAAFAYCAKLPESFHSTDVAQPTSAQAQCNPNGTANEKIGCIDEVNIATKRWLSIYYDSGYLNSLGAQCQAEFPGGGSGGHEDRATCLQKKLQDAGAKVGAQGK